MIVGLTGGIASGKTFCSDYLREAYGVLVVDADRIARDVVKPHSVGLLALVDAFGLSILNDVGELDRGAMRQRMLADDKVRVTLNAITHPLIRDSIINALTECRLVKPYCLLSAPLLFENKLHDQVDTVVVVDVAVSQQIHRAMQRDGADKHSIERMLSVQIKRSERLARAHFVVDNNDTQEHTRTQLDQLHQRLCVF